MGHMEATSATTEIFDGLIEVYYPFSQKRVQAELRILRTKREALEKFRSDLEQIETVQKPSGTATNTSTIANDFEGRGCEPIINSFKTHMDSYYEGAIEDFDSALGKMADEFNENLIFQLSDSDAVITPQIKQGLQREVDNNIERLNSIESALGEERDSLRVVEDTIYEIVSWVAKQKDIGLPGRDYKEMIELHNEVEGYIDELDELSEQRQQDIRKSTVNQSVGIEHSQLLNILYSDFPVDHPILRDIATTAEELYQFQDRLHSQISGSY